MSADLRRQEIESSLAQRDGDLFRFETQIQKDRLKAHGLTRLSDVTEASAWEALERRWDMTAWGTPLPSRTGLSEAVRALPIAQREGLLGYLHLVANGETEDMTSSHHRTRREQAKRVGVIPGQPVELLGAPGFKLDLHAGALVSLVPEPELDASSGEGWEGDSTDAVGL